MSNLLIHTRATEVRELSNYYIYIDDCDHDNLNDRMFEYGELTLINDLIEMGILIASDEYIHHLDNLINLYKSKLEDFGCL